MSKKALILCLFLFSNYSLFAEKAAEPSMIKNSINLGASINTGNSPTKDFTGEYKRENELSYPDDAWGYDFILGGQWSTAQGEKNAENAHSSIEGRYLYSEQHYLFGKLAYTYDAFATYDMTANGIVGLGYIVINNKVQKLTLEAGPGGTYQRVAGSQETKHSVLGHGDVNYRYVISDTATFNQTATIDYSSFNTSYQTISSLTSQIVKNIALKFSFTVNHVTTIPENSSNTKKTDTATTATILYNF